VIVQALGAEGTTTALLEHGSGSLSVAGCDLIVVNAGQSGYYRTLYSPAHFSAIKSNFAKLAPIDQLGIFADTASMGLAGLQAPADIMDLIAATPEQADPQLWRAVTAALSNLDYYYRDLGARRERLRAFGKARLSPVLKQIGWNAQPGESDTTSVLRDELIGTLGELGDAEVIAAARKIYAASLTDAAAMPAALRRTLLGVVAQHADLTTWEQLHAAAVIDKTPLVKDLHYALLASTEDVTLAQRALAMALTDEPGATNSVEMMSVVANLHPEMAFDFAVANLSAVNAFVDGGLRSEFYPDLAAGSIEAGTIAKLKAYANKHIVVSARRSANTAVARITDRIKVRTERLSTIDRWLVSHNY
jgi:aminopeptidase N